MHFSIEKKISNFIANQFPQFYHEEGENFILFAKAYYEWMESSGGPVGEARTLLDYRDIDSTLDDFLEHFQTKYLYGIPFDVIVNKRFLLKHILDVYRSKGSIQCYKLLFKLIYNQDVEVYLPGEDILKASDGTWVQPKYLEINDNGNLESFVGNKIFGVTSGTSAIVENFVKEPINQGIVSTFTITNISPFGGLFIQGEKIIVDGKRSANDISTAPVILGSLDYLKIENGGQNFQQGDILKIAHYSVSNVSQIIATGTNGRLRVTQVARGQGSINFNLVEGGFGYLSNTKVFVYNGTGDTTGNGALFSVGNRSYIRNISYNTDLICDYASLPINSSTYGLPSNTSANSASRIVPSLAYTNGAFGTIATLTDIFTGNGYSQAPYVFVRSTQLSKTLTGTVNMSTSSNTITGTGTNFNYYFSANDVIALQANSITTDYQVIKSVTNSTSIILYGPPKYSNTVAAFKAAPVILPSNFALYDPEMVRSDATINGKNEIITALPSSGNNIVAAVTAIGSGKGYIDNEFVNAYRYNVLTTPEILSGGLGYANNDKLVFTGGGYNSIAVGYVTTNSIGGITASVLTYTGSGYFNIPTITVNTTNGTGASLTSTIQEFDTTNLIQGKVVKSGIGRDVGYWSTTRGFMNSDKYIQDSYFYQDYSYQIRTASTLDKYKNILYTTFHTAGSELFGEFFKTIRESSLVGILNESSAAIFNIMSDSTLYTSDNTLITVDDLYDPMITSDSTYLTADSTLYRSDLTTY